MLDSFLFLPAAGASTLLREGQTVGQVDIDYFESVSLCVFDK